MRKDWKPGDWAVYRKSKVSTSPGPRATNIVASKKGENYSYFVDKFWIVDELLPDGEIRVRTARGKIHVVRSDDPCLRRPSLLQRIAWRNRFRLAETTGKPADAAEKPVDVPSPGNSTG